MAKKLKYKKQDKIDQAIIGARHAAFNELSHDFRKACLRRFAETSLEWEEADTDPEDFYTPLRTIAAKDPLEWTEEDLIDMALYANILWNVTEEEEEEEEE